jgi:6-pyruvoyltetrahydropterin/6-carboxytetrahydropterin synthase
MTKQTITRKGSADIAHRVMREIAKCFNIHGHTYLYELTFEFTSSEDIGYNIDFKEIKRIGSQWIDDILDHGVMLNPLDTDFIELAHKLKSKLWLMSLNGEGNMCNPTVENIAKEVFLAMDVLFNGRQGLKIKHVRMYETPNCYTDCYEESISQEERSNFMKAREQELIQYRELKGVVEYDERKLTACADGTFV